MSTRKTKQLPARLEATRRRFEQWRCTHQIRRRIPDSLWALAVKMAGAYGVAQTAKALRVDYYSLKERIQKETSSPAKPERSPVATFFELAAPGRSVACECLLELEDWAGAKMRVHLKGVEAPDLAALSRSFWES